jgi:hypothetical protein
MYESTLASSINRAVPHTVRVAALLYSYSYSSTELPAVNLQDCVQNLTYEL